MRELHEQWEWLHVTLSSIGNAVITTDTHGGATLLNPVAQSLTGWTQEEEAGKSLDTVFKIVNEASRHTVENPAIRALREGVVVGLLVRKEQVEFLTNRGGLEASHNRRCRSRKPASRPHDPCGCWRWMTTKIRF